MMESRLGFDAMAALALAGTALLGEEPAAHCALARCSGERPAARSRSCV